MFNTEEEYFSYKALSASQVKQYAESPYKFWKNSVFNPEKKEMKETDALIFGKLTHCMLLEPEEVEKRFVVLDWGTKTRGSKGYEATKNQFKDMILVSPAEFEKAKKMLANLRGHKLANSIIDGAKTEMPIEWIDEETNLPFKCKIDAIKKTKNGIVVIDYKSSSDIGAMLKYGEKFHYPLQDAVYCEAIEAKYGEPPAEFVFIAQSSVEDEEDVIAVVNVDYDSRMAAKDILRRYKGEIADKLLRWQETGDKDIWSAFPNRMLMRYSNYYLDRIGE